MNNIKIVKEWCEENKFTYEEDIEKGIIYITNKLIYEGFTKGCRVTDSMIKIMCMKEEYLEEYLKGIKRDLHNFN